MFSKCARVAELVDARDLKSRGLYGPWGFDSPPGHHVIQDTYGRVGVGSGWKGSI